MVTIFFVIDGLGLEAHAALLAASLVHHNGDRFRYVGYVAARHHPVLSADLKALMDRCGVELRVLPTGERPWYKPYPHGNKILAAAEARDTSHSLFLDTDMICTAPIDLSGLLAERGIGVVAEGVRSYSDMKRWERIYAHFNLPLPAERIRLLRRWKVAFLPYFNAGFICFPESPVADGKRFADLWLDTALTIDHLVLVAQKRPWLDQISLPVTLKRFGLSYILADEMLNFSTSERSPDGGEKPILMHYHRWGYLANWPAARAAALAQTRKIAGKALFARLQTSYGAFWTAAPLQEDADLEVEPGPDRVQSVEPD